MTDQEGRIPHAAAQAVPGQTISGPATNTASLWARIRAEADSLLAASAVLVALGFALYGVSTTSIWYDEAWSFQLASQPLAVMKLYVWGLFQNMALYYVVLHYWLRTLQVLGVPPTELMLRLPSLIFAALSAAVVYLLGRRLWSRPAGIVASALFIINASQLYAAQQARAYSLQLLLICVGWYAFFCALASSSRRDRTKWWICYIAAMTLGIYAQLFTALVLASQLAAFGGLLLLRGPWRDRTRASIYWFIGSVATVCVCSIPVVFDAIVNGGESTWIQAVALSDVYSGLLLPIANNSPIYLALLSGVSVLALVGAGQAFYKIRVHPTGRAATDRAATPTTSHLEDPSPGTFAVVCWMLVPVVLSFAATQPGFNHHLFYRRYLVVIVPALCLLVGVGVSCIRWRTAQMAAAALLMGVAVATVPGYYATAQVQNFRSPLLWLEHKYQTGDGIACYPDLECVVGADYYLTAYPSTAHFDGDSPGWWRWQYYSPVSSNLATLTTYAAQHTRIFLIDAPISGANSEDGKFKAMQEWLMSHGRLVSQSVTPSVVIQLYELNSGTGTSVVAP